MKIKKIIGYVLSLFLISIFLYSTMNIKETKEVYANEITYDDFYGFNELPDSDIFLTDTFELITADGGSNTGINHGPSIDPNRSDVAIITQNKQWQFGGLWYKHQINMEKDFSMLMYVNLGEKWDNGDYNGTGGADGITFTIQGHTNTSGVALNRTIGANGAGLGAYSKDKDDNDPFNSYRANYIRNALVLEFDTFYNSQEENTNDNGAPNFGNDGANGAKFYGHLDLTKTPNWTGADSAPFYKEHDISEEYFRSPNDLNNAGDQDLTDQRWRKVEVNWDSSTHTLTYNIAGYDPIVYVFNNQQDVRETFGGSTVYWGFTGSTGNSYNLQQVGIFDLPDQTDKTFEKVTRNITKDGQSSEFSDSTIMKMGDIIEYKVTMEYPDENNTQEIVEAFLNDELAQELEYVPNSLVVQQNGTNVTPTADWNDGNISLGTFGPGNTFVVTYQAEVLEEGIIDNIATFRSKYTRPISDSAQVYNGSIKIIKVDGNNQPLAGAEFRIEGPDGFSVELPRSGEESASSYTVDYLEPGDYTIMETSAPEGYLLSADPQTITIERGMVESEVTFINYNSPSIAKAQKNSYEDDEGFGEESETLVGDNVDFKITSILPADFSEYTKFKIIDELDSRLTYVNDSVQLSFNLSESLILGTDYEVSMIDNVLEIELTTSGINQLEDVEELYLTFTAQLNETTLDRLADIPNKAKNEFTNSTNISGTPESNETITIPLTGEVSIIKIFKDGIGAEPPLPNAKFTLQKKSGDTWDIFGEDLFSDIDGLLGWDELSKGEYRIIELKAPEGYLLLANPIEFEITSDELTHEQSYKVENKPKEELPQTGGIGTMIFTLTGILLMTIAGVSALTLIRRKSS